MLFFSVNLIDAYFGIRIYPDFKKYLTSEWKRNFYRFVVLPFGVSSSPRIFTKVIKPIYAALREKGIKCCYFIDDSLTMNQNYFLLFKSNE